MSAKYRSPSFLLPNEINTNTNPLNTDGNPATGTGVNSLYSMNFDSASSDYIDVGNPTELQITGALTISAWVKINSTSPAQVCIVSKDNVTDRSYDLWGRIAADGFPRFVIYNSNTGYSVSGTTDLKDNQWHHIVAVFTPNTSMKIYVDNVLENTNSTSIPSSIDNDPANFEIGRFGYGTYPMDGKIDEVAIFNRALDSTEISALYGGTSPNIYPSNLIASNLNPVAYYPLGEQAQMQGYLGNEASSEWQFPNGVLQDYVMDFDSTSPGDYVSLGDLTNVESNEFTISMWVNKDNIATNSVLFNSGTAAAPNNSVTFQHTGSTFYIGIGGAGASTLPAGLSSGVWYNFILTVNGTTAKLYIDGNQFGSNITVGSVRTGIGSEAVLGKYNFGTFANFDGKMSNVAIWNTDQSTNIANIYNNGSPQTTYTVTPQNWWKLNADSVYTPSAPNYTTALDFVNSQSDYISFPDISLTGEFTISFWMKHNSFGVVPIGDDFSQNWLRIHTSTQTDLDLANSKSSWNSGATFTTGEWQHVVLRRDSSNVCTIFRNGIHYTNNSPTKPGTFGPLNKIGQKQNGGYWNGQLSNLAIFNSALSASQVSTLFNFGTPETNISFSPQAWWKLDDQTAITDYSGNGNTGTNNGATDISSGVAVTPSWKIPTALPIQTPNYTTALDFNADHIDFGNSIGNLIGDNYTGGFTVSFWINPTTTGNDDGIFTFPGTGGISFVVRQNDFRLYNNGQKFSFDYGTNSNKEWSHCVLSFLPSGSVFYVNSIPVKNWTYTDLDLNGKNLEVGWYANSNTYSFIGQLSNFQIWNTNLSSTEASALYNNGTPVAALSGMPQSSNLISWWKLDTGGSTITDSAGSNNGTNSTPGAIQIISDVLAPQPSNGVSTTLPSTALQQSDLQFDSPYSNYSLSFDGTGDYIDCGDSDIFSFGDGTSDSPFSFSAWVNFIDATNSMILSKHTTGQFEYSFLVMSNDKLIFQLNSQLGSSLISRYYNTPITGYEGQWIHLVGTYDGSRSASGIKIYLNGTRVDDTDFISGTYLAMNNGTAPVEIGKRSTDYMNGKIDETSIFNTELTSAQVLEIYNNGRPKDLTTFSGTAPISWWRLGENAYFNDVPAFTVPNSISGAPNGTGSGSVTTMISADAPGTYANGIGTNLDILDRVGDAPLSTSNSQSYNMIPSDISPYVPGYVGNQISNIYSMVFDGVNDYMNTNYSITSGNKTISFWFNSSYAGYQCIMGNANDSFILGTFSSQIPTPNGISYFQGSSSKQFGVTASVTDEFADGQWHHFVYTYDGNSKIYIDGTERTISYKSGTLSSDDIVVVSNLALGLNRASYPKYSGKLDEVAIFDTALNADQIYNDIYQPTKTGTNQTADIANNPNLPNPVAWYRMGD